LKKYVRVQTGRHLLPQNPSKEPKEPASHLLLIDWISEHSRNLTMGDKKKK
jgi:hypothetical protein